MSFFESNIFWFIEGLLACVAIIAFKMWMQDKGINMAAWKWAVVIVWVLFLAISIGFVTTSIGEGEMDAAFYGGVFGAVIAAVSGVVAWRLLKIR
jgi:cytochrome b subunit of formate dehydrogenase